MIELKTFEEDHAEQLVRKANISLYWLSVPQQLRLTYSYILNQFLLISHIPSYLGIYTGKPTAKTSITILDNLSHRLGTTKRSQGSTHIFSISSPSPTQWNLENKHNSTIFSIFSYFRKFRITVNHITDENEIDLEHINLILGATLHQVLSFLQGVIELTHPITLGQREMFNFFRTFFRSF